MFETRIILSNNIEEIHEVYSRMRSQKAESCGPYSITPILISYGFTYHDGNVVDEDYISYIAKTRMLKSEANERKKIMDRIKRGEMSYKEALEKSYHILYKYELPITEKESEAGTSVHGLVYAIETISNKKLRVIPIPSRKGNEVFFSEKIFKDLVQWLITNLTRFNIQIILNYRTEHLLDPTSSEYNYFNILLNWDHPEKFPKWKWKVGHFVGVNGFKIFKDGGAEEIYFIVRDTYKEYGFNGIHLQPLENVRKALVRGDGREGGILIIVDNEEYQTVYEGLKMIEGLRFGIWDNGSPF